MGDPGPANWIELENRRGNERRGMRVRARITHRTTSLEGSLEDLSTTGARFVTRDLTHPLSDGAWVELTFRCYRGSRRLELSTLARVVWQKNYTDGNDLLREFGVKFPQQLDLRSVRFSP